MPLKDIILTVLGQCRYNFTCVPLLRDHLSSKTTFSWQTQMTGFTIFDD